MRKYLQPYFFISVAGLLAFAPVSFMLRALKNDIIALEYPINYFISQSVRQGEIPYWFNTWGMGFPLQSNLTWGIFSTPQMLFSSLFDYNIYVLHIEFMFFILLAGWGMFHLLQKYLVKDQKIAQLLAICYMLSGFMTGSTQWLLYITAAAFIPLVISSLLQLLHSPTSRHAFQFAVFYTLMFTSVYAAFNIITTYSLAIFLIIYFIQKKNDAQTNWFVFRKLLLAGTFTLLLCSPCLYYSTELLRNMARGSAIADNTNFFNSNYLHPASLSNLLLPFSSVRINLPNTEGTMLNTYMGLFVLLLLPAAIYKTVKEKNKPAVWILAAGLLFLFISFGHFTPLRNALNSIPGFSYFRNPAIFRLYFILSMIYFIALSFRSVTFENMFTLKTNYAGKIVSLTTLSLLGICGIVLLVNFKHIHDIPTDSFAGFVKNINFSQTLFINAFLQLIILTTWLILVKTRKIKLAGLVLTADLIINTLLCTPFFSVSSYSLRQVNHILKSSAGFPIQNTRISQVATTYTDGKMNKWNNVNVFNKQVSSNDSYRGPLTLKHSYSFPTDSTEALTFFNTPLVFADGDTAANALKLILQKPNHIRVNVILEKASSVTLIQNYYPGWKAFYNKKIADIIKTGKPGMTIKVPEGEGVIDFVYERKSVWISALLVHLIIISFLLWRGYYFIKGKRSELLPFHSDSNGLIH
ncbi:MAG: hypothetical protein WBB06_15060 [Chitinophagaceae bacterium]